MMYPWLKTVKSQKIHCFQGNILHELNGISQDSVSAHILIRDISRAIRKSISIFLIKENLCWISSVPQWNRSPFIQYTYVYQNVVNESCQHFKRKLNYIEQRFIFWTFSSASRQLLEAWTAFYFKETFCLWTITRDTQ